MGYRDMIYEQNFWKKIIELYGFIWNAFEVSNVSLFLDLSANYNVFFWHDLWNDAWIGWMVFCYENILFEMLWWSMIEHIDFMMHYIDWFRYYMIIYFIIEIRIWNMIYKEFWYKNIMNWQPDYVKDPANGGIYVGNWFVLRVYVARETSDKPPERPAVPKDFAARWFAAYRKHIRGVMILPREKYGHSSWLTKRIEEWKKLKSQKKLEFSKKEMNLA